MVCELVLACRLGFIFWSLGGFGKLRCFVLGDLSRGLTLRRSGRLLFCSKGRNQVDAGRYGADVFGKFGFGTIFLIEAECLFASGEDDLGRFLIGFIRLDAGYS